MFNTEWCTFVSNVRLDDVRTFFVFLAASTIDGAKNNNKEKAQNMVTV